MRTAELEKYNYGNVTLVGLFEPNIDDYDPAKPPPYGLAQAVQFWGGAFRGASGSFYTVMRGATPWRLQLARTRPGAPTEECTEAMNSYRGPFRSVAEGGEWRIEGGDTAWSLAVRPGARCTGRYEEAAILSLDMRGTSPACQFYSPGPRREFYYFNQYFHYSGEILGDPVTGVGGVDMMWMPAGTRWEEVAFNFYDVWCGSFTEFDDGSFETIFVFGSRSGRSLGGMWATDKGSEVLRAVRADFDSPPLAPSLQHPGTRRLPERVRFDAGGRVWDWVPDHPVSINHPRNTSILWGYGRCWQLGETRQVKRSEAFLELPSKPPSRVP